MQENKLLNSMLLEDFVEHKRPPSYNSTAQNEVKRFLIKQELPTKDYNRHRATYTNLLKSSTDTRTRLDKLIDDNDGYASQVIKRSKMSANNNSQALNKYHQIAKIINGFFINASQYLDSYDRNSKGAVKGGMALFNRTVSVSNMGIKEVNALITDLLKRLGGLLKGTFDIDKALKTLKEFEKNCAKVFKKKVGNSEVVVTEGMFDMFRNSETVIANYLKSIDAPHGDVKELTSTIKSMEDYRKKYLKDLEEIQAFDFADEDYTIYGSRKSDVSNMYSSRMLEKNYVLMMSAIGDCEQNHVGVIDIAKSKLKGMASSQKPVKEIISKAKEYLNVIKSNFNEFEKSVYLPLKKINDNFLKEMKGDKDIVKYNVNLLVAGKNVEHIVASIKKVTGKSTVLKESLDPLFEGVFDFFKSTETVISDYSKQSQWNKKESEKFQSLYKKFGTIIDEYDVKLEELFSIDIAGERLGIFGVPRKFYEKNDLSLDIIAENHIFYNTMNDISFFHIYEIKKYLERVRDLISKGKDIKNVIMKTKEYLKMVKYKFKIFNEGIYMVIKRIYVAFNKAYNKEKSIDNFNKQLRIAVDKLQSKSDSIIKISKHETIVNEGLIQ